MSGMVHPGGRTLTVRQGQIAAAWVSSLQTSILFE